MPLPADTADSVRPAVDAARLFFGVALAAWYAPESTKWQDSARTTPPRRTRTPWHRGTT